MPIHKAEALVLRRRDFRETSLIVDFYTREFGKLSGILKGVRAKPGKFGSSVEPFSLNSIVFYRSRTSDLHLVSQCDLLENFNNVRTNMQKTGMATFMLEFIGAVMQAEDKNEEVLDLVINCLRELEATHSAEKVLVVFKIKMLMLSGFKPHFDSCVSCNCRIIDQSKFSLTRGGLLCPQCFPKDTAGRTLFRGTIATILHIERNDFRKNMTLGLNPQVKRELEIILNAFLHFHLDKELKSQRVLNNLEQYTLTGV